MNLKILALTAALFAAINDCCFSSSVPSFILPFTDCVQSRGKDGFYRGAIDVTESGTRCMNWTQVAGFKERYPGKGIGDHNHCRNPDGRIRPWCFFKNHRGRVDWGYCDCKQGSVRLQGGRSKLDGRVEVYLGGVWGSVCSDYWGDEDAAVVCRQFGKGISGHARSVPLLRPGMAKLHWNAVHCQGEEPDLLQCPKSTWNGGECSLVAAVTCTQQQAAVTLPIRLVGGRSRSEGRVEVFHAGQWGSICDDQWDDSDAEVVCRQLGLSGAAMARGQAHFGKGSGRVWLDEVRCTGNELTLEQCSKSAWGEQNCLHSEDAGVSCNPLTDGTVRLVGGAGSHEGRLEVFYRGQWGTVCDDGWTDSNTQVVCRQLGYRLGEARLSEGLDITPVLRFGVGSGPILLDDVSCTGKEPSLLLCNKGEWFRHDCTHHEDVNIACSPEHNGDRLPASVPLRLVGGESPGEGRVEIYLSGQWGTVCDDGWSDHDAEVVCRQLGYTYGNNTKQYKVRVGDYHSLVPEEFEEEYGVDQIVLHPSYHSHSNDYDLALVRLSPGAVGHMQGECVSFSRHVLPACLPMRKERVLKQASNCHITGWGDTGRSYSKTLQQASLYLLPRRHCQQHFHSAFTSRMLCAGSIRSDKRVDSCRGDSGGPLVCERPGGGWVVYGVTSWGHACRTQQSPGVYTKVSAFTSWIHKVIGHNEKKR
ncbi:neurotrypsin isoform X3 [Channa argus]|uniref:neurotrypsin isoform X3 n=1 Tax=Channa argus TaxID=215402 RepID=UPI00351FA0C0